MDGIAIGRGTGPFVPLFSQIVEHLQHADWLDLSNCGLGRPDASGAHAVCDAGDVADAVKEVCLALCCSGWHDCCSCVFCAR